MNGREFLPMGKVPPKSLIKVFARHLGVPTDRLISGPAIGEDAAIIDMGDRVLVLATDPITAAIENVGWLSVHINANDIATCGAKPLWYLCSILLPEKANEELFEVIMRQVDRAARELDVSVIGGHSEVTLGLNRSIIIGFMVGEAAKDKYVSSSGARPGDEVILTKQAGIEGTAILASDLAKILRGKIGGETLESARNFIRKISVVKEAMIAVDIGGIDAMHDPTEGGLINGLWELAEASRVGITVYEEKIPIAYETKSICKALNIDPLQVMGSGALLIVVKSNKVNNVAFALQSEGIMTSVIGKVTRLENGRRMIKGNGSSIELAPPEQDHVYKVLEEFSIKSL